MSCNLIAWPCTCKTHRMLLLLVKVTYLLIHKKKYRVEHRTLKTIVYYSSQIIIRTIDISKLVGTIYISRSEKLEYVTRRSFQVITTHQQHFHESTIEYLSKCINEISNIASEIAIYQNKWGCAKDHTLNKFLIRRVRGHSRWNSLFPCTYSQTWIFPSVRVVLSVTFIPGFVKFVD